MKLLKWIDVKTIPLYYQIICLFIMILIPLYITGYILLNRSQEIVVEQINVSAIKNIEYFLNSLEHNFQSILKLEYDSMNDVDFDKYATKNLIVSDYELYSIYSRIRKRMITISNVSAFAEEVAVHFPEVDKTISSSTGLIGLSDKYRIFENLAANSLTARLYYIDNSIYLITASPANWIKHGSPKFIITAKLSNQYLQKSLLKTAQSEHGAVLLTNEHGWYLSSTSEVLSKDQLAQVMDGTAGKISGISSATFGDVDYLLSWQSLKDFSLKLIIVENLTKINQPVVQFRFFYTVLSILFLVLAFFYAILIRRLVKNPIKTLVDAFSSLQKGDFSRRLQVKPKNEIGYLYRRYNKMVETISHLIHEVYEAKLLAQRSELKHLQTQINPHFLYNCFFLLNGQLQLGDTETASEMARRLGKYFQFITRNDQDKIPLSAEYSQAITYIEIQRLRFGSRADIRYETLPYEIGDFPVPRLIIQPLVENAFEHGIRNIPSGGIVLLSASYHEGIIIISVEDNGEEFEEFRLDELTRSFLAGNGKAYLEGTALENIRKRLEISHGSTGYLTAERGRLGGLKISIVISTK